MNITENILFTLALVCFCAPEALLLNAEYRERLGRDLNHYARHLYAGVIASLVAAAFAASAGSTVFAWFCAIVDAAEFLLARLTDRIDL